MKKIYLVDSENVGDVWVPLLVTSQPEDQVLVFYTQKSPHMNYENVRMLKETEKEAVFIKCFEGSNALDFQLVTELGFRLKDDVDCEYIIVSNDTGFDAAVRYWSARKMPVRRLSGKDCSKKTANLGRQTETKPQAEQTLKLQFGAGESSVSGQVQPADESVGKEQDSEAGIVREEKTEHAEPSVSEKEERVSKASKNGLKKAVSGKSGERLNKDSTKVSEEALEKDDPKVSEEALEKDDTKRPKVGTAPDEPKATEAGAEIIENRISPAKAAADSVDIPKAEAAADKDKVAQPNTSDIKAEPDFSKEKGKAEKKKLPAKKAETKQKKSSDELPGGSKTEASDESSVPDKSMDSNSSSLMSQNEASGLEDTIIKNLFFCISKENLADFHNALVMFFGEEKGKEIYQDVKNDPESMLDWSQIPERPQAEKFEMYCKLVFEHGELAEGYPADFAGFLLKCNGKRKNLNSLRAALQGQYGKDKGMKYYSLFKSHIKIMNRM